MVPSGALAFLAVSPILTVFLFLVILRWPARRAMPLALAVAAVVSMTVWKVSGASSLHRLRNPR